MPRPSRFIEGAVYGRLTALIRILEHKALYRCICGTEKTILVKHVLSGKTQSCGCLRKEVSSDTMTKLSTKHGMYGTPVYNVWNSMMDRCCNPKNHAFENYGGRGISVDQSWFEFETFFADMGLPPEGMSLERLNNNLGYSKENCKWATWSEQANNRRSCVSLIYKNETKTVTQWAVHLNIPRSLIFDRLRSDWPVARIFETPKRVHSKESS